jgi:tetratricopeptide (TPR) repeat protein
MAVADAHAGAGSRKSGKTDFRLVLNRLERDLVAGENADRCRRILSRKVLWKRLEPRAQLAWARLAQLAGEVDTALDVLSHVNSRAPDLSQAWEPRLELLVILGRRDNAVSVLEAARRHIDPARYPDLYTLERSCPPLGQVIAACRGGREITLREEKVLYQTIGFLPDRKTLLHHLMSQLSDYNPHMVDYRLSRLRGTPLGCRRIHSLLGFGGDFCRFETAAAYPHPLLHLGQGEEEVPRAAEKAQNLTAALQDLDAALERVRRFMK